MMKNITKEMNHLPRLSYRWLKVNHFALNEELEFPIKPYELSYSPANLDTALNFQANDWTKGEEGAHFFTSPGVSSELVQLAKAHSNAGFKLQIPARKKVEHPVTISYRLTGDNNAVINHNLIVAEPNSSITIVVDYHSDGQAIAFHNGLTKIVALEGADVTFIKVQRLGDQSFHFDAHQVEVGAYAKVRFLQVELGGKYSVTNYLGRLEANGDAIVDGIYFGDGERILDLSYHMIHEGYRSNSAILVRGALKDHSRKVFRGTLDFKRGSHLANGNEEEYVFLLDPTVKSDAIPLLLSEEDNVQGGHAASAGKVDMDQLFYLMARGLSEKEATEVVVNGSFQHVLDQLPHGLKGEVQGELHRKLVSNHA